MKIGEKTTIERCGKRLSVRYSGEIRYFFGDREVFEDNYNYYVKFGPRWSRVDKESEEATIVRSRLATERLRHDV